jgi:hypothetical protein
MIGHVFIMKHGLSMGGFFLPVIKFDAVLGIRIAIDVLVVHGKIVESIRLQEEHDY